MTQRISHIEHNLAVGYVASTLYGMLPRIIYRWRQQYPDTPSRCTKWAPVSKLARSKRAKSMWASAACVEDSLVRRILLRHEKLVVALPQGHPLAQRGGALKLN